jgi:16S rRNA (guanine1207-N2)-methyltransferase
MNETLFISEFGRFRLERRPSIARQNLRAWDAADEYLLRELAEQQTKLQNLLIVNDSFGALSVALHEFKPQNWSDSWLAHQACRENLHRNNLRENAVSFLQSLQSPPSPLDVVLIKIPKTLALLEYQLLVLKPLLKPESKILLAGMTRAMPSSLWKFLERIIGPTQTRPALKKAKLIQLQRDTSLPDVENPYPLCWPLEQSEFTICNHANVFSRERLDIGARFMLQHLPQTQGAGEIIDLGCGNGVLGLMAAAQNLQASVYFVDESYMAVESARLNCRQLKHPPGRLHFHTTDGLTGFDDDSADLILCNPPFHQQQAIGDFIALSMFRHAARVLREDGELWVIGNRHLGYHKKLKKDFRSVTLAASNSKFVILKAAK